jgi:hypothetical protein
MLGIEATERRVGRAHHRSFDAGLLALAPYLTPEVERELRQALTHAGCAELEAGRRSNQLSYRSERPS